MKFCEAGVWSLFFCKKVQTFMISNIQYCHTVWCVLQPVIKYTPAKKKGLGCSLFERYAKKIAETKDKGAVKEYAETKDKNSLLMLRIQYRMVSKMHLTSVSVVCLFQHEAICEFPSKEFYDEKLKTDSSVAQQFYALEGFWPNGPNCPIAFCDVEGKEVDGSSHHKVYQETMSNRIEAEKIVSD